MGSRMSIGGLVCGLALVATPTAQAGEYDAIFTDAADEFGVPAPLLKAMAWEASRGDPTVTTAWGGYGMFDFREPGEEGPDIERIATLLDVSPDDLIDDPDLQIHGAAALLAHYAGSWSYDGELPDVDALEDWSTAVSVFWGREAPALQNLYVGYIYEMIDGGFGNDRMLQVPVPVHYSIIPPPLASGEYAGTYTFISAHSSNYTASSRSGGDINYVIIHTIQGSYSSAISWFQNSSADVSAHYCIRSSDGQITQMLSESDIGWHAGNWTYNEESIGIEHEGFVEEPEKYYTTSMYTESALLTADIVSRTSVSADRSHIIGHNEVPGATHTDPGSGWDWDYYMGLVGGSGESGGARLLGVVADGDIYDEDARLVGATVTVDGESTTSDGDGMWIFSGISAGTYTITASYPGFADGSCTTTVSGSADHWCSIALEPGGDTEPGDSGTDGGGEDTDTGGVVDTGTPGTDTGGGPGGDGGGGPSGPGDGGPGGDTLGAQFGERMPITETRSGCASTNGSGAGFAFGLLGLLGLAARRRRG